MLVQADDKLILQPPRPLVWALRSLTGTEGALKAMLHNEETTNRLYRQALEAGVPADARVVVEWNHGDERQHLASEALDSCVWEEAA